MTLWSLILVLCCGVTPPSDPAALATRIDHHIDATLQKQKITPAPRADDSEFHRRLYLDLIGRIPSATDVTRFLAETNPAKRSQLIQKLLADSRHFDHFAHTWRALLLPEAETDLQLDYFRPGLEAWLRDQRSRNTSFQTMVQELLAAPIATSKDSPEMVLRDLRKPNLMGYFAAKEAKPENLAGSATRLFLGYRIECAQCHDHPFDNWTQEQFWNQAAFFAGLERQGKGAFSPLVDTPGPRDIAMAQTKKSVPALYLDGQKPAITPQQSPRIPFATWLTANQNKQFARATVNRIWGELLGSGLVDPVDDFHDGNPASHPELLEELTQAFIDSNYDLSYLINGICLSQAYQRTSRHLEGSHSDPHLFASMAVKQMSGEQFVESLLTALGLPIEDDPLRVGRNRDPLHLRLLDLFASSGQFRDPQTSIIQALELMNGPIVNDTLHAGKSPLLSKLTASQDPLPSKIETLYLATLNRLPNQNERERMTKFVSGGTPQEVSAKLGDALWILLNSLEFRCNH